MLLICCVCSVVSFFLCVCVWGGGRTAFVFGVVVFLCGVFVDLFAGKGGGDCRFVWF